MGVTEYVKETKAELKKVNWPTRRQVASFTFAIIMVSILMSALLGVFDFAFSSALGQVLLLRKGSAPVSTPGATTTLPGVPVAIEENGTTGTDTTAGGAPVPGNVGVLPSTGSGSGGTLPILPNQ